MLFGICLALGLLTALLPDRRSGGSANPPPTATAGTLPGQDSPQHTFLILGVDRLDVPTPRLRAVWLATFRSPGRDLFLLGLPTSYRTPIGDAASLEETFTWTPGRGPSDEFLTGLQYPAPVTLEVIVALDEVGFAALIDHVGGIDLNGVPLSGEQSVAVLHMLVEDPSAALSTQARLLEALVARAGSLGPTPDLTPLIALMPAHAFLSMPASQAIAIAAPLLPLEPATVHVDLLATP
jgi:hypothetical protein